MYSLKEKLTILTFHINVDCKFKVLIINVIFLINI